MINIAPVIDYALLYNPNLAFRDIHTVVMWCNAGCDVDKDILPTMQALIAKYNATRNDRIKTFSYFTRAVEEARDRRKAAEPVVLTPEEQADKTHAKARRIAWIRARYKNMHLPQEFRWLEQYEGKYGKVSIG